ncbi:MAG: UpxY family transcription antiterminator [Bacteroidetes bacterium]|nr:UpxY family transcription antiterminator [Bacteroidota bacterium]MBS1756747.1 UpxY family transcription antiterminator [Bacteroidota bacterium]
MKKTWYAVYTKSRCEKKVATLLAKKKIEHYCPLNRVVKEWSDRRKLVFEPLFTSYVFVRATDSEMATIRQTNDVINFVYWLGRPAVIKDVEIENMQSFLDVYTNVQLEKTAVNVNDLVRITSGPLMEMEGNIVSIQNNKVKVALPSLGYQLVAEVKKSNIEVLDYTYQIANMVS